MTDKVAIILSGCGVFDGSEIHEASAACGAVTRSGKKVVFYAPDKTLHHEINHISGESNDDTSRNVIIESGRIARGKVNPLADLKVDDVDAVIIPGMTTCKLTYLFTYVTKSHHFRRFWCCKKSLNVCNK